MSDGAVVRRAMGKERKARDEMGQVNGGHARKPGSGRCRREMDKTGSERQEGQNR